METTVNRFASKFDNEPILDGSEYIEADLGHGVTVRAYVEFDQFSTPEDSYATEEIRAAWRRDEWRFCEMMLHVYVHDVCIERDAATMCGIATGDGEYLTEVANDLLNQIDVPQAVRDFAAKMNVAAEQF